MPPATHRSFIWAHDAPDKPANQLYHVDSNGKEAWKCRYCLAKKWPKIITYSRMGGTGGPSRHLRTEHKSLINNPTNGDDNEATSSQQTLDLDSRPGSIVNAFRNDNERPHKRPKITKLEDVEPSVLLELFQNYIVDCTLSYRHIERSAFRTFVTYINPFAETLLPVSHTSVSTGVLARFEKEKNRMRALLATSLTRIHLSCDGWTSENAGKAYLGVTARFVTSMGRQQLVLAIKQLHGSHTGANMAEVMLKAADNFGIVTRVGFCNSDNAAPNDTMAAYMEESLRELGVDWPAKENRLRCVGHISNLAVQAFLHGKHPDSDLLAEFELPTTAQMAVWAKTGTLGTAHRLIIYIYASPQRRETFLALSNNLNLLRDNDTRWTSWYDTIERLIRLMDAVTIWQTRNQADKSIKPNEKPEYLTTEHWEQLENYFNFLKPYRDLSLETQGHSDGLDKVLLNMDILMDHMEDGMRTYADDNFFKTAIDTSWNVLKKYYNLTDESPAYVAAVVMDPRRKWGYFEKNWNTPTMRLHLAVAKQKARSASTH